MPRLCSSFRLTMNSSAQAAQGEVLYNDDTTFRILEMMGQRARKAPPPKDDGDPGRTGLFTSGVVATRAGVRIALFFSGTRHAGENLSHVLQHRAATGIARADV
jgi:transposase